VPRQVKKLDPPGQASQRVIVKRIRPLAWLAPVALCAAFAQRLLAPTAVAAQAGSPGGMIPGTPSDATLIATYPAASYAGYTATTSDLGPEQSDGTRWLILHPPVPPGAAALGYTKLIYALHPLASDVLVLGTTSPGRYYFVNGNPGVASGSNAALYTNVHGQLTLNNAGVSGDGASEPNIMATSTYNNGTAFAGMNSALPFLSASAGYYVEDARTLSNNNCDHWSSLWIWTVEAMSGSESADWVEFDINEDGFTYAWCAGLQGTTTSLIYWKHGSPATSHPTQLRSSNRFTQTNELIAGGAWDPVGKKIWEWNNGVNTGTIAFSAVGLPTAAWQGLHHFPLIGGGSHNVAGHPVAYTETIRYLMAWGPP
jgi:hypothetical protein